MPQLLKEAGQTQKKISCQMVAKEKNKIRKTKQQLKIFEPDYLTRLKNILPYTVVNIDLIKLWKQIIKNEIDYLYIDNQWFNCDEFLFKLELKASKKIPFNHTRHFVGACKLGSLGFPFIEFYLFNQHLIHPFYRFQNQIENINITKFIVKNAK